MSQDAFGQLMASLDPAMIVVTTVAEDEPAGCLVGFHAQSGISDERYCPWLSKANHTYRTGLRASHFAVHFLTREDVDKFSGIELDASDRGVPLLRALPNRLVAERVAILDDGADHPCFTTRVLSAHSSGPFTPLRLSDVAHLDAGRSSESRAVHP